MLAIAAPTSTDRVKDCHKSHATILWLHTSLPMDSSHPTQSIHIQSVIKSTAVLATPTGSKWIGSPLTYTRKIISYSAPMASGKWYVTVTLSVFYTASMTALL